MGDRLRASKLSRYVTSHPGQLSLTIPLWVGAMSTSLGWEGNCRSGVALACVTDDSGLSTYGLNGPPLPLHSSLLATAIPPSTLDTGQFTLAPAGRAENLTLDPSGTDNPTLTHSRGTSNFTLAPS